MSEIKYLPVREIARENGKIAHLKYFGYDGKTYYPVVSADVLKTADDLKAEGAEEYWQAFIKAYKLKASESYLEKNLSNLRKDAFGANYDRG